MEKNDYFIGIDISKAQLDMVIRPTGKHSTHGRQCPILSQ